MLSKAGGLSARPPASSSCSSATSAPAAGGAAAGKPILRVSFDKIQSG